MDRRAFLAATACLAAAAALPGCGLSRKQAAFARDLAPLPTRPDLAPWVATSWIPRGERENHYGRFKRTAEAATDFSWLKSGDRVLVKIALNSPHPYPATTDPWAVACMVRLLQEKGAGRVLVGDQSGVEHVLPTKDGCTGSSRDCALQAGVLRAITEGGAQPVFFEEAGYDAYLEVTPRGPHHWPHPLYVTSLLEQVDHVLYLARVSSHAVGGATLGLKLPVGFLREDSRRTFHAGGADFNRMYEEINEVPALADRLRLVVSTGTSVLTTIGPDIGHVAEPPQGLVLASRDLLAHEVAATAWLRYCQAHHTPAGARLAGRMVAGNRSAIHRHWGRKTWKGVPLPVTADRPPGAVATRNDLFTAVPAWFDADPWSHPAVVNRMSRIGGRPSQVVLQQVDGRPEPGVLEALEDLLRTPSA